MCKRYKSFFSCIIVNLSIFISSCHTLKKYNYEITSIEFARKLKEHGLLEKDTKLLFENIKDKRFSWPLAGAVTSEFGLRWGRPHNGIDIDGVTGEKILSSNAGKVVYSGRQRGYGRVIIIKHKSGYRTLYAHCNSLLRKKGEFVNRGDVIATVGSSGNARGSHLHFEIIHNKKARNPRSFLGKRIKRPVTIESLVVK